MANPLRDYRTNIIVMLLVAVLTVTLWAILNRPNSEPIWPTVIKGFSFSPLHKDQDPAKGEFPTLEQIDADLALLANETESIRTYTVESTLGEIPRLAAKHGLKVTLGAWVDSRMERNLQELVKLVKVANDNADSVSQVIIGNEVLLTNQLPLGELATYLDRVRRQIPQPVSVAEPWHVWLEHPQLVNRVDFITIHLLPYWEKLPVDKAVDYALKRYEEVQAAYPDKRIVIGEVGWPSNGRQRGGAVASEANEAQFLRRFLSLAESRGWDYFVIEAFDQPWKSSTEGAVGAYWGVYDVDRVAKFPFTQPIVSIPHWRELSAISIVLGIITLLFVYRDSNALSSFGRAFLALVTYGAATGSVWLVYEYTSQYLTPGTVILGLAMLVAIFGLILVLLAEAHEWAESLWQRETRRPFRMPTVREERLPFVSIHVPAYNEPPEMLKETLDHLVRLDYPNFEVLVVDNNTKDPAVWQPVEAYCQQLGERFRFFHVDPLEGFKAGALNFALRQTAAEADIVAVIDSDYFVTPNWLRDLAPAFADPKVAIVQAPQDYRDADENAFKAMCHAEYRGFFHIGMITRNERNAIIQHGTMTMVNRQVLEDVGAWSEWCITEDAELGLRIFEQGYEALYIPRSYGRGLIPDNFLNFKKQRFRWAYGAVIILKKHFRELAGAVDTRLTAGQRYHFVAGWLPWLSDGLSLVFNAAALIWTIGMILMPDYFDPPLLIFAIFPLVLFAFKLLKLWFLYSHRVGASWRQNIGAAIAGLAVAHTISRAILTGMVNNKIGFFRTPKLASKSALLQALADVREELLMMLVLWLGAAVVIPAQGAEMLDVRIWAIMLLVQSIPYAAAVFMSVVSAMPRLSAQWVGVLGDMPEQPGVIERRAQDNQTQ